MDVLPLLPALAPSQPPSVREGSQQLGWDCCGNEMVELGGGRALVVERQFLGSEWWAVQEEVREWAEVRGRLTCRVIRYELQSDSQLCQSVYTLRALL